MFLLILLPSFLFFILCSQLFFINSANAQVIINEVYPNPFAGESEWVELVNIGTSSVDLSDWVIQDQLSTPKNIFQFDKDILQPNSYLIASFSGQLNNGGDGANLIDSDLNLVSMMSYDSSIQGQSWSYDFQSEEYCLTDPTINSINIPADEDDDSVEEENNLTDDIKPSPTSSSETVLENLFGKLSLLKVMSCPENSDEWFELQNISNHFISEELSLVDEQDNIFLFSINLSAGQSSRYYLDRHILNNAGDQISLIQGTDNTLMTYQIPECKEKNKEFILLDGVLKQIDQITNSEQQVLGFSTVSVENKSLENFVEEEDQFTIDSLYLRNLQLDIKEDSIATKESDLMLENEVVDLDTSLPIFTLFLIFTGTILSFLGIIYFYVTEAKQNNTLD